MNLSYWLNTGWMLKSSTEAWAFHRATRRVAQTQARILADILRRNAACEFGRRHDFSHITDPRTFQKRVPLAVHEDLAPAVQRIAAGEPNILTTEPVTLLQPTSGTVSGEKLIPYTASLRRQFQRAVSAWVANMFWHYPRARAGRAYWSISPSLGPPRRTSGGIAIGFDDDAAYLGAMERRALDYLLVAPAESARRADMETFRYRTLLALLAADDLALISVWSPTFLTSLLEPLEQWLDRLCFDLGNARRAQELQVIFRTGETLAEKLRRIWPRLALISCWTDAAAALALPRLQQLFPEVPVQSKGVLATEGFVSFPLAGHPGAALAVRSHFLEFQSASLAGTAGSEDCLLAHEVEHGQRYRIVLTTGGGLYRYQLHDEVEIVGFVGQCPLMRFLGKAERIVDLVGEKLAEIHVRTVLERVLARHGLTTASALLVPIVGTPSRYRLYFQSRCDDHGVSLLAVQADVQAGLEENPYYRQAVQLGQLGPVELWELSSGAESIWSIYERRCLELGQKAGNIKPAALDGWSGWPAAMARALPQAAG